MHTPTTIALVILVIALASLGAFTGNATLVTMAPSALTGLFAYLQIRKDPPAKD